MWVPDAAHEALRDLVRAREAAKKDQLRARHRLGKFLLRHGRRRPVGINAWTQRHLTWVKREVHFEYPAQEATFLDYLHEVEHVADRIARLEGAIDRAVTTAPRLDLCSRFIVGWAVSAVNDRHLTIRALEMALKRRCPDAGLLHHSDQGCTYASEDYQAILTAHDITCSMSRRGNCHDNAVMGSPPDTACRSRRSRTRSCRRPSVDSAPRR